MNLNVSFLRAILPSLLFLVACSSSENPPNNTDSSTDSIVVEEATTDSPFDVHTDVSIDSPPDTYFASKAGACASTFGTKLPAGFVRLDGVVTAIVAPTDTQCAMPNSTHVVVQIRIQGEVYRAVLNVMSTLSGVDPDVRFATLQHTLPSPAFSEGIHQVSAFDYARILDVHSTDVRFTPTQSAMLIKSVVNMIPLGAKISIYSQGSGGSSTHKIHRNKGDDDGAIVLEPDSSTPTFMLFHFANQTF